MKRKKYIVGNWKMFKTADTAYNDFLILQNHLENKSAFTEQDSLLKSAPFHVGICAPFVFLPQLSDLANNIDIYAQNVFWEKEGAFTGEVSVPMLKSVGVTGSLVAHSERRQYFHETNFTAGKKLKALFENELRAIYCVGESLQERENGHVQSVIKTQLEDALSVCKENLQNAQSTLLSIAYEPVWAIGTGKAATVSDAHDVHVLIRETIAKILGTNIAENTRILYGGSVKPSNAKEFLSDHEIDGALVGGASLNPNEFFKLCMESCM